MNTTPVGRQTATCGDAAPILIHPDGAVTIRATPRAWRFLADAAAGAVDRSDGLLGLADTQGFYGLVAQDVSAEDSPDVHRDAALVLGALAILARAQLGRFIQGGLTFVHHGVGPLLDELADLGVVPFDSDATLTSVVEALVATDGTGA